MNSVHKNRLLKLATFLETLPPERFDLSGFVIEYKTKGGRACGTVCCAVGWCPKVFPDHWRWKEYTYNDGCIPKLKRNPSGILLDIKAFFGINDADIEYLFMPGKYPQGHRNAKYVARRIRSFVKRQEALQ